MDQSSDSLARLRADVSIDRVYAARRIVRAHLPRSPLVAHPVLAEAVGCSVRVKHENHLPTGAFKIRGGLNYMANLPPESRARGVIAATRGNHGQSVALAARIFGVRATVVVPIGNNPEKNAAIKAYGAELIEHGRDFDEACQCVDQLVAERGLVYVHSGNEPHLINGVSTYWLEVLEDMPEVDVVIAPVGGGSGICAAINVFRALKPSVRIIGVQAENAPALYRSWKTGVPTTTESADTFADGIATRIPFDLPFAMIREGVDDIVLVSEEELRDAVRLYLSATHNLVEGAGAAPLAGLLKLRESLQGKSVAIVASGGNMDRQTLRRCLS